MLTIRKEKPGCLGRVKLLTTGESLSGMAVTFAVCAFGFGFFGFGLPRFLSFQEIIKLHRAFGFLFNARNNLALREAVAGCITIDRRRRYLDQGREVLVG